MFFINLIKPAVTISISFVVVVESIVSNTLIRLGESHCSLDIDQC